MALENGYSHHFPPQPLPLNDMRQAWAERRTADRAFRGNGDSPHFRAKHPLPWSIPSDQSDQSDPSDYDHDHDHD
jgi:hypothetical protein